MSRRAACCCGALTVAAEVDPVRVSICHCLACQRRTGSVFGVQARFPADRVRVEGPVTRYVRTAESGNRVTFAFCPTCGSTVFWEIEALPGFVAVAVGAFADTNFPAPKIAVYEAHRHGWIPELDVEHWD